MDRINQQFIKLAILTIGLSLTINLLYAVDIFPNTISYSIDPLTNSYLGNRRYVL